MLRSVIPGAAVAGPDPGRYLDGITVAVRVVARRGGRGGHAADGQFTALLDRGFALTGGRRFKGDGAAVVGCGDTAAVLIELQGQGIGLVQILAGAGVDEGVVDFFPGAVLLEVDVFREHNGLTTAVAQVEMLLKRAAFGNDLNAAFCGGDGSAESAVHGIGFHKILLLLLVAACDFIRPVWAEPLCGWYSAGESQRPVCQMAHSLSQSGAKVERGSRVTGRVFASGKGTGDCMAGAAGTEETRPERIISRHTRGLCLAVVRRLTLAGILAPLPRPMPERRMA